MDATNEGDTYTDTLTQTSTQTHTDNSFIVFCILSYVCIKLLYEDPSLAAAGYMGTV